MSIVKDLASEFPSDVDKMVEVEAPILREGVKKVVHDLKEGTVNVIHDLEHAQFKKAVHDVGCGTKDIVHDLADTVHLAKEEMVHQIVDDSVNAALIVGKDMIDSGILKKSEFIQTIAHIREDISAFISTEQPYSVKADREGISKGTFAVQNAALALEVNEMKDKLKDRIDKEVYLKVTYFQNWGRTADESNGLLILAKPKTVKQVCQLVKEARELGLKVHTHVHT